MKGFLQQLIATLALTALVGCSGQNAQLGQVGQLEGSDHQGIVGGEAVMSDDLVSRSTVALYFTGFPQPGRVANYCTGTLIGPRTVLTAAHCFLDASKANDKSVEQWRELSRVGFGLKVVSDLGDTQVRMIEIENVMLHPDYREDSVNEADKVPMPDVAVLTLSEPAPKGYIPAALLDAKSALSRGLELTLAGYGLTDGRLRRKATELRKVNVLVYDPDFSPVQFTYRVASRKSACSGDSGGPAYITRGSRLMVVGVTSWGDMTCSQIGAYTSVPALSTWIRTAMAQGLR